MSSSQSNIYSQSFNYGSFLQKGVDPRTGQYTCSIEIYETPSQVRNCPPFKLSLGFNPLNSQNAGLGTGWSFSLSSYEHNSRRTLLLSTGENYQVTDTSSLFSVDDQKLKSFTIKRGDGDYEVIYKSGLIEVLSNDKKRWDRSLPTVLYAPNGRSLQLEYKSYNGQPRLIKIQDGSEDLLSINYDVSGEVSITRAPDTPEANTFVLSLKSERLTSITTPLSAMPPWKFDYDKLGDLTCITEVTSPTGLVEAIAYNAVGHQMPSGAPLDERIPYVVSHMAYPSRQQPRIKTTYSYSDYNFLGYGGGRHWENGEDNLYRVPADYKYTSTVTIDGGSTTEYTYNKFHLPIRTTQKKGTKLMTQTTEYYALADTAFEKQPAQYLLPKSVTTTYEDTQSKQTRTETSTSEFDEWGNPTKDVQADGVAVLRTYYPPTGATDPDTGEEVCPADPHGFQRYKATETTVPAESDYPSLPRTEHYTYCELPTATDARVDKFVVVKQSRVLEGDTCVSTAEYSTINKPDSRDHGRAESQVTQLAEQHPTTQTWEYKYSDSSNQLKQTITTKSFDGLTVSDETDISLSSGLTMSHKDQDEVQDRFEYDKLGQILKVTTAVGTGYETSRENKYGIPEDGHGSQKTVIDTEGFETRYITDGLERLCEVEKQDSDASTAAGTTRKVQECKYNALDQCIEKVEIDWLRSDSGAVEKRNSQKLEYDDWGEVYKTTDNTGVVSISETDPIARTRIEGIEGEGQTKTTLNKSGAPILTELLRKDGTPYSQFKYFYDGLGRLVEQEDALGRKSRFQLDAFDRVVKTTYPSGREVTTDYAPHSDATLPVSVSENGATMGAQDFDGLNRVKTKTVGTCTVKHEYEGNGPEPSKIQTHKGDSFNFTYEPALGHAVTATSINGAADTIEYDPKTGVPFKLENAYSSRDLRFFPSGLLKGETVTLNDERTFSSASVYSMNGKLQAYTDVHGQEYKTEYDPFDRVEALAQGTMKVSFTYDSINRPSDIEVQDTARNTSLTTSLKYDDFSREEERIVRQGGKTLYKLTQSYTKTGLVEARHLEDGNGTSLRDETFDYDDDGHLVHYTSEGSQSPTDEQGRQLKSQHFVFGDHDNLNEVTTHFHDSSKNTTSYSYNRQDPTQLTAVTKSHDSQTVFLDYDDNGCLTLDEQGRRLEYNSKNQLISVRDADDTLLSQYHYDAGGRLACQSIPGQDDHHLFYRDEKLIAVQTGDRKISYISDSQDYFGQTVQNGSNTETQLWASDSHDSLLFWADGDEVHHQEYTPYGVSSPSQGRPSIGFNGQWRDPVTGWYHLGNGYRVYNPVLKRFHTPDPWSPFTSGETNPYAYCLGDPINRDDPSGHGFFGWLKKKWKKIVTTAIGVVASVAVGMLTGGASLAVQIGIGLAVGAATEFGVSVATDLIEHKPVDWGKAGISAGVGALTGAVSATGMFVLDKGSKAVAKLAGDSVKTGMKEAGKQAVKETVKKTGLKKVVKEVAEGLVFTEGVTNAVIMPNLPGKLSSTGLVYEMLDDSGGGSSSAGGSAQGSAGTRDSIRPIMRDGESAVGGLRM
ncbi:RHS repeat protein [Aspergillus campestris IBT 28561]|uniref:RHS repeat protein n=1 Tax=Aspergillus campestris (strain IBT 28561) TaxID=1392248 RepID=A0A2I1CT27_ASPC2|nr:RHS repeat protein [Aspergillus campestris IBT 28561]PKY00783.1 RHS repeat protein [Aspergillus campestris IBT 28561]